MTAVQPGAHRWTSCAVCARLHRAWITTLTHSARDELAAHIVAQHPSLIPLDDPDCSKCRRYSATLALPDAMLTQPVRAMLTQISREHRVEIHLISRQLSDEGGTISSID